MNHQYTIFPLGDSAATIELSTMMNESLNKKTLAIQKWFEKNKFEGLKDIVVAYSSLTIVYDPFVTQTKHQLPGSAYQWIANMVEQSYEQASIEEQTQDSVRIPVCYNQEFGIDLKQISETKNLTIEEIIELHESKTYRVYMLGFLPGFAYLGEIHKELIMPRKETPVPVNAGSVGIASNQTGIYPLPSPGGWQIIGRTPVKLFDAKAVNPVKLKAGDQVKFYGITSDEFYRTDWSK